MSTSQQPAPMWFEELPYKESWSSLWRGYMLCGKCRGIRGEGPSCPVCGTGHSGFETQVARSPDGRNVTVTTTAMGAEGRYEDWVYLSMMEREWKRPLLEADPAAGTFMNSGMSPRATIVVLFWSYFETRIERLFRAGLAEAPQRLLDDALRRYSAIGARLNDFYRIAFDSTYREDLISVGRADIWPHLATIQERRNAFAHGQPAAINDELVQKTVEMMRAEHEAWIAVFNKRAARP